MNGVRKIRVLCADDSTTMRFALTRFLQSDVGIELVGMAEDGRRAVDMAANLEPDVVTMDAMMPRLDGLEATREIMAHRPCRILMVSAVSETAQVDLGFRALEAGALDLLQKPDATSPQVLEAWGDMLCAKIYALAGLPVAAGKNWSASVLAAKKAGNLKGIRYFGMVASTGGPPLLAELLGGIDPPPYSILIAQHITPGFTEGLKRWLKSRSTLEIGVALHGELALPGCVYLAPDGRDLLLGQDGRIQTPLSPGGVCPCGDRLLSSLAGKGPAAAAVVLTGMGADGAEGLKRMRESGATTLVQDEDSSMVYGMPKEAWERGGASRRVSPHGLITLMRTLFVRG